MTEVRSNGNEVATLAGGCFWCQEAVFQELRGVSSVTSGYTGGRIAEPSYRQVCAGTTGHAEAVRIVFDPTVISYRELLEVFFATHDPTTPDRQGADVGPQYRSAIFYHSPEQLATAEAVIADLAREHAFGAPIVTERVSAGEFYAAEDYHADYYARNRQQPYCRIVIDPKVAKLRKRFREKLRA